MSTYTTIGIASREDRQSSLYEVLKRLSPQADIIWVYLGYKAVPDWYVEFENVKWEVMQEEDMGDTGKFVGFALAGKSTEYYLTCDDDLFYPDNYVEFMIEGAKRYRNEAVVCMHGWDAKPNQVSYHRDRAAWHHFNSDVPLDTPCHIPGTLGMCFHTSLCPDLTLDVFERPNMADLWMGKYCSERGIPRIVLAHKKGFLPNSDLYDMGKSIWAESSASREKEEFQTDVLNSIEWDHGDPEVLRWTSAL